MSKHVNIPIQNSIATARIDIERFAKFVAKLQDEPRPLVPTPMSWFDTSLLAHGCDGLVKVTPRGADLLASIDNIPNDPEPEVKAAACSKCNGTGETVLFAYLVTCDRCKGSKTEPVDSSARPINARCWRGHVDAHVRTVVHIPGCAVCEVGETVLVRGFTSDDTVRIECVITEIVGRTSHNSNVRVRRLSA